jgi:hypothetical protein
VQTQAPDDSTDTDQMQLFPGGSELAPAKESAAAVTVETVLTPMIPQIAAYPSTTAQVAARDALLPHSDSIRALLLLCPLLRDDYSFATL